MEDVIPYTEMLSFAGFGATLIGSIMFSIVPALPTSILYPPNEIGCVTGVGGNPGNRTTRITPSTVIVTS